MGRKAAKDSDAKKRVADALVNVFRVVRNTSQMSALMRGLGVPEDALKKIVPHSLNELEAALSSWLGMKGYNREGLRINKAGKTVVQQDPDEDSEDPDTDDDDDNDVDTDDEEEEEE